MRRWVTLSLCVAAMLGSAQAPRAGEQIPHVVVSVAPLAPYVDAILKDITTSQSLVRPGQDPHHFSLSPSQSKMLNEADILIIPDSGINPLITRLTAKLPRLKVIELSKLPGADPLPYAAKNPWLEKVKFVAKEHDDEETQQYKSPMEPTRKKLTAPAPATTDPHFWLDPERMAAIAAPLASAMADFAPDQRRTLDYNAAALAHHLRREVIPGIKALLQPHAGDDIHYTKPDVPFVTYHAAYQYFMARFELAHTGEIMTRPEDYQGAETLDQLLNAAKNLRIHCIMTETETTLVQRLAKLSGAKIITLSPEQVVAQNEVPMSGWAKNDYDRLLQKTALSFGQCL